MAETTLTLSNNEYEISKNGGSRSVLIDDTSVWDGAKIAVQHRGKHGSTFISTSIKFSETDGTRFDYRGIVAGKGCFIVLSDATINTNIIINVD